MRIKVHLFAAAAQAAQSRHVEIDIDPGTTLGQLAAAISAAHPELRNLVSISRWAVDHQFAGLETLINQQREIAMIPPVSGG